MSAKDQEVEKLHQEFLALIRNTQPTNDTVRDIARLRLRLIELIGEDEQRKLIGQWNLER